MTPRNLDTQNGKTEEGFTLIELMIVVVVIGILAAVAIPIFVNQQKGAAEATLKSDLKNAALAMQTAAATNGGKYPSALPEDFNASNGNLITLDDSAGNLYADPTFQNGATGWRNATVSPETAPNGNAVLLNRRDHRMTTDSITVRPGDVLEITATVKRVVGEESLQAGVWKSTGMPTGCGPSLVYPTLTDKQVLATYDDGWVTYRNTFSVPTQYRNGTDSTCSDREMPTQFEVSPFFQIRQGLEGQDPHGTTQYLVSNVIYRNLSELARENPSSVDLASGKRLANSYCIEGRSNTDQNSVWRVTSENPVPTQGRCSA